MFYGKTNTGEKANAPSASNFNSILIILLWLASSIQRAGTCKSTESKHRYTRPQSLQEILVRVIFDCERLTSIVCFQVKLLLSI